MPYPLVSFGAVVGSDTVRTALWLSLRTSLAATALALVLGVPLALSHAPVIPRTRRLVLVDRADFGFHLRAAVDAGLVIADVPAV